MQRVFLLLYFIFITFHFTLSPLFTYLRWIRSGYDVGVVIKVGVEIWSGTVMEWKDEGVE